MLPWGSLKSKTVAGAALNRDGQRRQVMPSATGLQGDKLARHVPHSHLICNVPSGGESDVVRTRPDRVHHALRAQRSAISDEPDLSHRETLQGKIVASPSCSGRTRSLLHTSQTDAPTKKGRRPVGVAAPALRRARQEQDYRRAAGKNECR